MENYMNTARRHNGKPFQREAFGPSVTSRHKELTVVSGTFWEDAITFRSAVSGS